jgi:hypothetical protein
MSQGCWHVKPSEVRHMIETVKQTGLHVRAVEVTRGIEQATTDILARAKKRTV